MQVDERTVETMKKAGFYPLEKEEGKEAFAVALSSGFCNLLYFTEMSKLTIMFSNYMNEKTIFRQMKEREKYRII